MDQRCSGETFPLGGRCLSWAGPAPAPWSWSIPRPLFLVAVAGQLWASSSGPAVALEAVAEMGTAK